MVRSMADRVVYAAPDINAPVGGIRVIYRHVELLTRAGYDAAVWHHAKGATLDWFNSSAHVLSGSVLELSETDVLVVPEIFVFHGWDPAPGCRKIIYNQNHFLTFASAAAGDYPTWEPAPSLWVSSFTSRDVLTRLRDVLHVQTVEHVPLAIDTELFRPSRTRERKVVWMPRKRPRESALIHALLSSDKRFNRVTLRPIDGLSERRTAAELGSASVFISLGREEGFGLPVAEALASGCAVVGHPGGGGSELFEAPGTYAVPESDVIAIVEQTANLILNEPSKEERCNYSSWIKKRYPESQKLERLTQAIAYAREKPAAAGTAIHPFPYWSDCKQHAR